MPRAVLPLEQSRQLGTFWVPTGPPCGHSKSSEDRCTAPPRPSREERIQFTMRYLRPVGRKWFSRPRESCFIGGRGCTCSGLKDGRNTPTRRYGTCLMIVLLWEMFWQ